MGKCSVFIPSHSHLAIISMFFPIPTELEQHLPFPWDSDGIPMEIPDIDVSLDWSDVC